MPNYSIEINLPVKTGSTPAETYATLALSYANQALGLF